MQTKRYFMKLYFFLVLTLLSACDSWDTPRRVHLTIGTGGLTGVYYPTGQSIAKLLNQKKKQHNLKAQAESTAGSVYNINALLAGEMEVALAQSDRVYQAYQGEKEWKEAGPQRELRSLFALHSEVVTLIVSKASGIQQFQDLKGKRINLGNLGSGQLANAQDALNAFGISVNDIQAEYVKAIEAPGLLQDERLDAFFYTVGHPNGNIKEAANGRLPIRILPITGPEIKLMILEQPYYSLAGIPLKYYQKGAMDEVAQSFGVKAMVLTRAQVSDEIAYWVTKQTFDNLEEFKATHPAFAGLTKANMLQGLFAPLHPGAIRYYKEVGMRIPPNLLPPHE